MRVLRLREHAITESVALAAAEVKWLRDCNAGLSVFATGSPSRFDVKASERVGLVVGPTCSVVIEPKTPLANLLFLLGDGAGLELGPAAPLAADASLVEAMGDLFAETLERAVRAGGLVAQYEERHDELPAPRGRIDWLAVQTRRFGLFPPIACTTTDLVLDTEINRRLLSALIAMSRMVAVPSVRDRLVSLLPRFSGVTYRRYHQAPLASVILDRRTSRFGGALRLAEAILRGLSVSLHEGETSSPSFLVDMNDVFERFVVRALAEAVEKEGFLLRYHAEGIFLDVGRRFEVVPDGVLYAPRLEPLAIVDAKYKISSVGQADDLYQALAYCTAVGVRRGALIYVGNADCEHEIDHSSIRVLVLGIDLSRDPKQIRERIAALGRRLITPALAA